MDKSYEVKYHEQEAKNWWFVARRRCIIRQLKEHRVAAEAKIVDMGSAGGILPLKLMEQGYPNVYAVDYSEEAIALCKERGVANAFVMDAHRPDFPENEFDVLIASDCLEHLEDDRLALQHWFRILKPGGIIIVYVPAFMWLWSEHDDINFHYRRYTRKELVGKMKDAGFTVERSGYWNFSIFFPTAAVRLFQKVFKRKKKNVSEEKDQLVLLPKAANSLLIQLVSFENRILSRITFPIGVSTFSIAKK